MSKLCDFIKECGAFFVLSINGDYPAGRPFGAIMEVDGDLYISTADTKAVYQQIKSDPHVQIVALKPGTRSWVRVCGVATECWDLSIKEKMLEECPVLGKHYTSANAPHYNIFKVSIAEIEYK